jgi:hypothetical protein
VRDVGAHTKGVCKRVSQKGQYSKALAEVLEVASQGFTELAAELGISTSALRHYRLGTRVPPPLLAIRLAERLRHRAALMARLSDKLETLAGTHTTRKGAAE